MKVLFYAYLTNIFSSRKIEKALHENIYFMWLSGKQFPDFRTINNFRSKHLKNHIQQIFSSIVLMLAEMGMIDIKKIAYTDGTKIEANANKYTFVWRGTINYHKANLETKLKKILEEIDAQIKEDSKSENTELFNNEQIDRELLSKKIEEINRRTKESNKLTSKQKQKIQNRLDNIKKKELSRLQKYEKQLEIMGTGRNSYSKTDTDATFMRMKDDHMKNGQLKAAYNIQISTQEQVITHFGIYQNRTDTGTYIDHLKSYNKSYGVYPQTVVADAGYGSQENYDFLEENKIENYVKYNWFHKEQKKKFKTDISRVNNLYYNKKEDYFVCPIGQKMYLKSEYKRTTENGYEQQISVYEAQNCKGCPLRGSCHKSKDNRVIHVNHKLLKHKEKVKENLLSEQGIKYRKKRSVEPESVFGQIKQNKGFRRFSLRGLEKVEVEFGLVAIAHNIQKLWKWLLSRENMRKIELLFIFLALKEQILSLKTKIKQKSPFKRISFAFLY
jgi:transposase